MQKVHAFEAPELVTKHVTVYTDRAEVKKLVTTTLNKGWNEVVVTKITRSVDSDSIRVDGRGKAVITEVKYQEKHVKRDEDIQKEEKRLRDQLTELREKRAKIEQQNLRMKKQKDVLEGVANQIGASQSSGCNEKDKPISGIALINDVTLDNLEKFLSYYSKRTNELDNEANDIQKKLTSLDEEISVIERNLHQVYNNDDAMSREVSIMLEANESGEVELDLSYVVWNAFWTPSYDLRVFTEDKLLQVTYYGLIQQNTNEEWTDARLSLSTAMPSVGGQVPELSTLKVGFYKPPPPPPPHRPMPMMKMMRAAAEPVADSYAAPGFVGSNAMGAPRFLASAMEMSTATAKENVISTSFEITHKTTIPSDNTSHKVTIALVNLKPAFEYETIPSKSPFAYLKAKVTNTSTFPFLPGPTSIFLDNNFVAKSHLKAVSPAEEFSCSLGVDAAVRVEYKPARKYNEESGLISKSSIINHEQTVEVKNTKSDSIKIKVIEQLPLSSEEKLKVNLVEPSSHNQKLSFRINKQNNVEWDLVIPTNDTRIVVLKYNLEHPKGEQLEYKEE